MHKKIAAKYTNNRFFVFVFHGFIVFFALACGRTLPEDVSGDFSYLQPPALTGSFNCNVATIYGDVCMEFPENQWILATAAEYCATGNPTDDSVFVVNDMPVVVDDKPCDRDWFDTMCIVEGDSGPAWLFFAGMTEDICEGKMDGSFWRYSKAARKAGDNPNFPTNSPPEVMISSEMFQSGEADMTDGWALLTAIAVDPDGDEIESYSWSTDCTLGYLTGDLSGSVVNLTIKGAENCTVSVKATDIFGATNNARVNLNISCVPLIVKGPGDTGAVEHYANGCAVQQWGCVPTVDPCLERICGTPVDDCGKEISCGSCEYGENCSEDGTSCAVVYESCAYVDGSTQLDACREYPNEQIIDFDGVMESPSENCMGNGHSPINATEGAGTYLENTLCEEDSTGYCLNGDGTRDYLYGGDVSECDPDDSATMASRCESMSAGTWTCLAD